MFGVKKRQVGAGFGFLQAPPVSIAATSLTGSNLILSIPEQGVIER